MRIDGQLKMLCLKSDMSLAEMARRLNNTPQAFNQKMKRGSFSVEELRDIIALHLQKMSLKIIIFKDPFILVFNNLKYVLERKKMLKFG